MGTRGLHIVRYRGRYYITYHQFDSYPEGWPKDLVNSIPTDREEYIKWLAKERVKYEGLHIAVSDDVTYHEKTAVLAPNATPEEYAAESAMYKERAERTVEVIKKHYFEHGFMEEEVQETMVSLNKMSLPPLYTTQYNDLWLEGIYTVDLDNEVFTVDNKAHFRLDCVSRIDWIAALHPDRRNGEVGLCDSVPLGAVGSIHRPLTGPDVSLQVAYQAMNVKIVKPKSLAGIASSQRHGPVLCLSLFRGFREELSGDLEHQLGSWSADDFPFREIVWLTLSFASLKRVSRTADELVKSGKCKGSKVVGDREIVVLPMTGAHAEGKPAGDWSTETTFWFDSVLVRLVPQLAEHDRVVEEQVALMWQHCRKQYPGQTIYAVLASVADVVLVKVFGNGNVEHSGPLPIFDVKQDYTVNAGFAHLTSEQLSQPLPELPRPAENGKEGKTSGTEARMMGLFNQLIFDPDMNAQRFSKEWSDLHGFSKSNEDAVNEGVPVESQTTEAKLEAMSESKEIQPDSELEPPKEKDDTAVDGAGAIEGGPSDPRNKTTDDIAGEAERDISEVDDNGEAGGPKKSQSEASRPKSMHHSCMQPIPDGYITTSWDEDGNVISVTRMRETVRNGQTITKIVPLDVEEESDAYLDDAFFALVKFMDVAARDKLAPYRHPRKVKGEHGVLPEEVCRLIINHVDDIRTYRACMDVSPLFHNLCLTNYRLCRIYVYVPNDLTSSEDTAATIKTAAQGELVYNSLDREDDFLLDMWKVRKPRQGMFGDESPDVGCIEFPLVGCTQGKKVLVRQGGIVLDHVPSPEQKAAMDKERKEKIEKRDRERKEKAEKEEKEKRELKEQEEKGGDNNQGKEGQEVEPETEPITEEEAKAEE